MNQNRPDSMISDPNLVLYACIAKRTTILAEYNSSSTSDPNLATLALQCLNNTPQLHSTFSQTVRNRMYTFLIDDPDPFVYFSICDEKMDRSECFWFLNRLKLALDENIQKSSIASSETVSSYCLQGEFNSVFASLLIHHNINRFDSVRSLNSELSLDLLNEKSVESIGYNAWKKLKNNKRRLICKNNNGDDGDDDDDDDKVVIDQNNKVAVDIIETREFSIALHKHGMYYSSDNESNSFVRRHKVNQIWRRHVVLALMIDLIVCSFLFGGWLVVCKGFKCIAE